MEKTIKDLQKQVYDGYNRIKELVDENQKLNNKLNDIISRELPPSLGGREK